MQTLISRRLPLTCANASGPHPSRLRATLLVGVLLFAACSPITETDSSESVREVPLGVFAAKVSADGGVPSSVLLLSAEDFANRYRDQIEAGRVVARSGSVYLYSLTQ